jgi:uncharacterized protein YkwD
MKKGNFFHIVLLLWFVLQGVETSKIINKKNIFNKMAIIENTIIIILSLIIIALIIVIIVYYFKKTKSNYVCPTDQTMIEITKYINMYREKNNAPSMMYDPTIAKVSQNYANELLKKNQNSSAVVLEHSQNPNYGENLAFFQGYGDNKLQLMKDAVDAWYDEIKYYNFNNPGFSSKTGHFTALVWKSSNKFGIGIAIDKTKNNMAFIVMNTSPPGNVIGEFPQNVLPPK